MGKEIYVVVSSCGGIVDDVRAFESEADALKEFEEQMSMEYDEFYAKVDSGEIDYSNYIARNNDVEAKLFQVPLIKSE